MKLEEPQNESIKQRHLNKIIKKKSQNHIWVIQKIIDLHLLTPYIWILKYQHLHMSA